MALAMARPWKHPRTGMYWLRRAVPADLRPLVGKREEKRTLGTRDPEEAKRKHLEALAELESRWAALRTGQAITGPAADAPKSLTEVEAQELAAWMFDHWIRRHRDNPSEQSFWRVDLYDRLWKLAVRSDTARASGTGIMLDSPDDLAARTLERWCLDEAETLIIVKDLVIDEPSRLKLAKALAAAVQRASQRLALMAQGHYEGVQGHSTPAAAPSAPQAHVAAPTAAVSFQSLFDGWAAEKRPAPKTIYEWQRVINELKAFVGHDDATRLTADDLIRWKSKMIAAELRPKTIRDAKLTPVRAILRWATDNRRIPANPAERITIDLKQKAGEGIRSFNDEEAAKILNAAKLETDPVRRWVPWLCAFSGARVSEVCQLRREDIVQIEGIWAMKFDPEAGSLKNRNSERAVPLHPALVEGGFLKFALSVKSGPLFAGLQPDKFGKRGGNGTKVLGRWVRGLGIKDERLSPNHSWRHRFKTAGRRYGLATDLVDAITGHARRTVADGYGEFPMTALHREILKIPSIR